MKKYYGLLAKKKSLYRDIKQEKIKLHRKFYKANQRIFRIMDIAMLLIILFNFGALAITNAMVVKKEPAIQLYESNPVQTKVLNKQYEQHPKGNTMFLTFLKFIFIWVLLISIYIYYRRYVFTEEGLFVMLVIFAYYAIAIISDFMNNFGYYIGKMIFGG